MLGGKRFLYKRFDPIPKVINSRLSVSHQNAASAVRPKEPVPPSEERVVIPPKIKRGPTDILKALSATVGYDPTAYPYKFPDDPYIDVKRLFHKKICALSMESGRKSAKWVIENNPTLFQHKVSEPYIKAFCPKLPAENETDFSEKDLICAIEERDVSNAIKIYEALKTKNSDVSHSTKQCLLELACFYNSSPVPETDVEVSWFNMEEEKIQSSSFWKKGGFAEQLFLEMDPKCPLANSALILGMFKFSDKDSALERFEKAREGNVKLSVETYNEYLKKIHYDSKSDIPFFKRSLADMAREGIRPNLGTLNSILHNLLRIKFLPQRKLWAEMVFEEFIGLGIEPSLGTYGHLITVYGKVAKKREIGHRSAVDEAYNILEKIEKKDHEIQHVDDLYFFMNTMNAASEDLVDPEFAKRLLNFYWANNNARFIVKSRHQEIFFRTFLSLLFKENRVEEAVNIFREYVFRVFHPDIKFLVEVFKSIEYNFTPEYLPEIWEITKNSGQDFRVVIARTLQLIKTFTDEKSLKVFHSAAELALEKIQQENIAFDQLDTFSNMLTAFAKCKDKDNIVKLLEVLKTSSIVTLSSYSLKEAKEFAMSINNFPLLLDILTLASEKSRDLANEIASEVAPSLSENERNLVKRFIKYKHKRKDGKKEVQNS